MNFLFDISWQLFHFLLIAILLLVVTAILSFIFKKIITLIIALVLVVGGVVFMLEQTKYSTFEELVSEQHNEVSTVRSIEISINDITGNLPEAEERITIDDEELINRILEDLSTIKLKKDENARFIGRKYTIGITINNEIRENFSRTTTTYLMIDEDYMDHYKIISETNHLKTIESVIESER